MNLADVRKQYPQYNDLSDDELVTGFHSKFYSDLPFDEFAAQVGYKRQGTLGKIGEFAGDVASGILTAPSTFAETLAGAQGMMDSINPAERVANAIAPGREAAKIAATNEFLGRSQQAREFIQDKTLSDTAKAQLQEQGRIAKDNDLGLIEGAQVAIGQSMLNPRNTLRQVLENLPSLLAGGAAMRAAKPMGAAAEGLAGYVTTGTLEGGGAYSQTLQEGVKQLARVDDDQLAQTFPSYADDLRADVPREQALLRLAGRAATTAGGISALFAPAVDKVLGGQRLDKALFTRNAADSVPKALAREGAAETLQGAGGQFSQNVGAKAFVDPTQSLTEGVGQAGGSEGFAGILTAGGMRALSPSGGDTPTPTPAPSPDPIQSAGPILAAPTVDTAIAEAFKSAGMRDLQDQAIALDGGNNASELVSGNTPATQGTPAIQAAGNSVPQTPDAVQNAAENLPAVDAAAPVNVATKPAPDMAQKAGNDDISAGRGAGGDISNSGISANVETSNSGVSSADGQQTNVAPRPDNATGVPGSAAAIEPAVAREAGVDSAPATGPAAQNERANAAPTGQVNGQPTDKNKLGRAGVDGVARDKSEESGIPVATQAQDMAKPASQRQPAPASGANQSERRAAQRYNPEVNKAFERARALQDAAKTTEEFAVADKALFDAEDLRLASQEAQQEIAAQPAPKYKDYGTTKDGIVTVRTFTTKKGADLFLTANKKKLAGYSARKDGSDWVLSKVDKPVVKRGPRAPQAQDHGLSPDQLDQLSGLREEIGWAEEGGRLLRDANGDAVARTAWVPKSPFWPNRPKNVTYRQAMGAINKVLAGQKLGPVEQQFIDYAKFVMANELDADALQSADVENLDADSLSAAVSIAEELADNNDYWAKGGQTGDAGLRAMGFTEEEINELQSQDQGTTDETAGREADGGIQRRGEPGESGAAAEGQEGEVTNSLNTSEERVKETAESAQVNPDTMSGKVSGKTPVETPVETPVQSGAPVSGAKVFSDNFVPTDKNGKIAPGFNADGGNIATTMLGTLHQAYAEKAAEEVAAGRLDKETADMAIAMFVAAKPMAEIRRAVEANGYKIAPDGSFKKDNKTAQNLNRNSGVSSDANLLSDAENNNPLIAAADRMTAAAERMASAAESFLQNQTPADLRAQAEAEVKAKAEADEKERKAAEAESKAQERETVRQRSEGAAADFQLGQSAMDNLTGQKTMFSRGGIWKSQMSDAIGTLMANQEPAKALSLKVEAWAKAGKFKQDELTWSGLSDWLKTQEGKVTKQQVQDFIRENGVQVEEVTLGREDSRRDLKTRRDADGSWSVVSENGEVIKSGMSERNADDFIDGAWDGDATKFSQYQLPGGENYRELLLTLPTKMPGELPAGFEVRAFAQGRWGVFGPGPLGENRYGSGVNREAALRTFFNEHGSSIGSRVFKSGHFDAPNILAHIRFNERTDAEGKRVLFVEEIQSDWAQKGRKEGFRENYKAEDIERLPDDAPEAQAPDRFWYFKVPGNVLQIPKSLYKTEADAIRHIETKPRDGKVVPAAPFVHNTTAWTSLAMKRMVKYAIDNGFDRVAWTTGEQQAARYDLAKQVNSIEYYKETHGDNVGKYEVTIKPITGRDIVREMGESELEDFVGKEVAQKIVNGEGAENRMGGRVLQGIDLKVGGEGMRGYYDRIVPNVANDLLKKLGGGKVETVTIRAAQSGNATHINYRTEEADGGGRKSELVYLVANDSDTVDKYYSPEMANGEVPWTTNKAKAYPLSVKRANELIEVFRGRLKENAQMGFTITDKMRESAQGGLPLFARNQKQAQSIQASDARAATEVITKKWKNAPKITVHESLTSDSVPAGLRSAMEKEGVTDARGAWYAGAIEIFPSNIGSLAELERTIVHEARHYGLEGLFGKDLNPILMEIYLKDKGVRTEANRLVKTLKVSTVDAVNETLANMPLDAAKKLPAWKKLVARMNKWLLDHGFVNLAATFKGPSADAITKDILYQVEQFVKTGKRGDTTFTTTLFSRDNVRSWLPNVRGGWTEEKIRKVLKAFGGKNSNGKIVQRIIAQYDNAADFADHIFYHGTGGYVSGSLKPSITMSERDAERRGGGGYGERYWAVSLSKNKNIASNFTGQSDVGSVYPVMLKKGAKVIDMPEIRDSQELENHIVRLWNEGVDAVRIGDWNNPNDEQELSVLNPAAIFKYENPDGFRVFQKKRFESLTPEQIEKIYADAVKTIPFLDSIRGMPKEQWQQEFSKLDRIQFSRTDQTESPALRKVDIFGNGSRVQYFDDAKGLFYESQRYPAGMTKWRAGEVVDGKDYWLSDKEYASMAEAQASVRGQRISNALKSRNQELYGDIPRTWDGDAKKIAKALIDAGVSIERFSQSTQSPSKYIYLSNGDKVRISNHVLPPSYDGADHDFIVGGNVNEFVRGITAPANSSDNSSRGTPESGMQERSGEPLNGQMEPAQVNGAGGGKRDITANPNFRKWFGDSKVVDSNGKPLVVYHGTVGDFNEFRRTRTGEFGPAIYTTDDVGEALGYAGGAGSRSLGQPPHNIMPLYVSLQNPYTKGVDAYWKEFNREGSTDAEAVQRAIAAGYDGVIATRKDYSGITLTHYIAFKPEQIKSAIGNNGDFSPSNPDIRFSRTAADAPKKWDAPEPSKMDSILYKLADKQIDLKRVTEAVRDGTGEILETWDAYLKETLFHGRSAKRVATFAQKELKPLLTDMQMRGVTIPELETYLHNRHAEERNKQVAKINPKLPDRGSGITTKDARAYLAGLTPEQRTKYEALAKRIDAITKGTRQTLQDYGLMSNAEIAQWEGAYKHYVPLMKDTEVTGQGEGFSIRGDESKRALGDGAIDSNILANLMAQRERAIVRGEKNRVALSLYGLAKLNPNADFWSVDNPPIIRRVVKLSDKIDRRTIPLGMDIPENATEVVVEGPDPMFLSRENVIVTKYYNPATDTVTEKAIVFNEDNPRAVRMAAALKNLDADQMGEIMNVMAKATRFLASVNTQYNPIFGLVNLTRDVQGAVLNLTSTELAGKQKQVLSLTPKALAAVYMTERNARKGREPKGEWGKLYDEFQNVGAQTGYRDLFTSSQDRADALQREINKITEGKVKQAGRAIFDWLSDYNQAMENSVRLAAYKVGLDQGLSKEAAANVAKNLTVNFNRKGQITQQAGALYAFFNASVQGTARLAQTLKGPAGKRILIGGLILGALQAMMLAGFDEDEPPQFERERNLIIPIGGKDYFKIPMPLGLHVIPNISRILIEMGIHGKPMERLFQLMSVTVDAFNPVGAVGLSAQTFTPTVADPFVALGENRDWTGKPIAREDFSSLNPTPGHSRSKDTASIISKTLSEGLNWASGGTEYTKGKISPTPDQLDYLFGQVGGGVWREGSKFQQSISSAFTGEELPPYKIPVIGRFYGSTGSQASKSALFYRNLKQLNAHEAEIEGRQKAGQDPSDYIRDHPDSELYQAANRIEREISKRMKQKRQMVKDNAPKSEVKDLENEMAELMHEFNQEVAARRGK